MPDVKFSNQYPYTDFHELNLDWVINEVKYWSTKVGKTIQSIVKTGTAGLVDTYTINYSDGTTSTFDVTNGNGIASVAKTGTVGLVDTYTITFQDGSTSTFDVTNGAAAVDPTLTLSDYAADAKVTGDNIRDTRNITDLFVHDTSMFSDVKILDQSTATYTNGMWLTDGTISQSSQSLIYNAIAMQDVVPGCTYKIAPFRGLYTLFDANGLNGTDSGVFPPNSTVIFTCPAGKYKIGISIRTSVATYEFTRTSPTQAEIDSYPYFVNELEIIPGNIVRQDSINLLAHLKGKKIVNFGDSLFGNFRDLSGSSMSASAQIAELTGATCYNAGFGGCRMASHSDPNFDAFCMYRLAAAIAANNWSTQDAAIINGSGTLPSYFSETLTMLKGIDWSTIDFITIGYGTNDFTAGKIEAAFKNALSSSIVDILTAYPNIKIVVVSPMYRWYMDADQHFTDDSDTHVNVTGNKLTDFVDWCQETAKEYHALYSDTYYYLGVNQYNRLQYFGSADGTHPNVTGRWIRSAKIAATLKESV